MAQPRRIVVCSLEDWDEVWRRNQYLVDSLMREDPTLEVLFVEPPTDPLHSLRRGRAAQLGKGMTEVDGYRGRLRTLQPTKILPRRFGAAADAMLTRSVLSTVRRLGWVSPALWINDPGWLPLLKSTGWPSVYDITDDWVQADRGEREHQRLARSDAALLEQCVEVVVCSPSLLASKGKAQNISLIRNAVDVARYRQPHERPSDLPDSPVALYVGTLHEDRLDVDLVIATAQRLSESGAALVLVGPNALTAHNTARLSESSAVLLGARGNQTIPAYLQHSRVLVVPHIIDDFTDSLDPIKLYEYFVVGRPIVSTAVAGFREEGAEQNLTIGGGETFVAAVASAVSEWLPTVIRNNVPDWPDRAREMQTVIERLFANPRGAS